MSVKTKHLVSAVLSLVLIFTAVIPAGLITANAGTFLLYWPLPDSSSVTAGFGDGRGHGAIDISAAKGTRVVASAPGYVTSTYTGCTHNFGKNYNCCYSLGNHVKIKHTGNIGGSSYSTRYGHLTDVFVKEGDYVQAGQIIGTVGSTGYSTGNHLDYKFYIGDTVTDPTPYLQIPSDVHYAGSDWENNGSFIQNMKKYSGINTTYGGPVSQVINPGTNGGSSNSGGTVVTTGSLYVRNCTYPSLMKKGATDAKLTGIIQSDSTIFAVTAQIITPDNRAVSSVARTPNSTSFDLSTISDKLNFPSLSAGDYILEVFATTAAGEKRLISLSFIVTDSDGIVIVENSLPDALKPGQSFPVKGEILSINPLTNVTIAILDKNGKAVQSRTVNPGSNTYDISKIDADIKFGTLAEGVYKYKITAKDNTGVSSVLVEKQFYVSNKKLITGYVTISGLGWSGASNASISSPYTYAVLTADVQIDQAEAPLKYQWYSNGAPISGATSKTYTVTSDKKGSRLSVSVTGTGNYFGTVTSEQTQPVRDKNSIIGDIASDITGRPTEYVINLSSKTVSPALPGTPCNELLEKVIFSDTFNGVYDKNLIPKSGTDSLCTGDSVRSAIGQITISRYYVVVVGDVNGDGKANSTDARMILRHAAKLETIQTAWSQNAADADHINGINSSDARVVLRAAAKLSSLSAT